MRDRTKILQVLRRHEADLRRRGVSALYLFGSAARNEATDRSDIDLFFDYEDPRFSLFDVMDLEEVLGTLLHNRVDVMTRSSLHPALRSTIERSAIQVF